MSLLDVNDVEEDVRETFPLHFAVFENDVASLASLLEKNDIREKINELDVHGRSPVMLATQLAHIECSELLLANGADANTQNRGRLKHLFSFTYESSTSINYRDVVAFARSCEFSRSRLSEESPY